MERNGYTEKEQELIERFGFGDLIDHVDIPHILYRMCVEVAFLNELEGPATDSLRRVYKALMQCTVIGTLKNLRI